jgi:hypothetical protein
MAQRLKRWESPRREGRNDKGKGGSARQRQLKKQTQMLRKKLKDQSRSENQNKKSGERTRNSSRFSFWVFYSCLNRHTMYFEELEAAKTKYAR